MRSPFGIGVLGCGTMARSLVPRLAGDGRFRLAAFWDPSATASAAMAVHAAGAARDSALAVCASRDVDLVYVASPPATHLAHLALAAAHGKPMLCEKPLAVDVAAAEETIRRANQLGWRAAVNFGFAASPPVEALVAALRRGDIGDVTQVEIRLRFGRWPRPWQADAAWLSYRHAGGFGREVLSHFIFLLVRAIGVPEVVDREVAWPADPAMAETALHARLRIGSTTVEIDAAVAGEIDDDNACTFIGTRGRLRTVDWYCAQAWTGGEWQPLPHAASVETAYAATRAGLVTQLARFAGNEAHALATLEEAWQVQRVIEDLVSGEPWRKR